MVLWFRDYRLARLEFRKSFFFVVHLKVEIEPIAIHNFNSYIHNTQIKHQETYNRNTRLLNYAAFDFIVLRTMSSRN